MSDATELILKQFGGFGALMVVAGWVIRKLWSDAAEVTKKNTDALLAANAALTKALAESNEQQRADFKEMTAQILKITTDYVAAIANGSNAIEAAGAVMTETQQTLRDVTEELRRRMK